MAFRFRMFTGEQIRAGRALARVEQAELARLCGLSVETIKRLERTRGPVEATVRTLNAIGEAFQQLGVSFESEDDGSIAVRLGGYSAPAAAAPVRSPAGDAAGRGLHRLIYYSTISASAAVHMRRTLTDILSVAMVRNSTQGVTGALLACNGRFLQVLEGPKDAVQQIYGAICTDPRHHDVRIMQNRPIGARQFGEWSLCCGIFTTDGDVLSQEPGMADGFRPETLSPASALGLLRIVSEMQKELPRAMRGVPTECSLVGRCLDHTCTGRIAAAEGAFQRAGSTH